MIVNETLANVLNIIFENVLDGEFIEVPTSKDIDTSVVYKPASIEDEAKFDEIFIPYMDHLSGGRFSKMNTEVFKVVRQS